MISTFNDFYNNKFSHIDLNKKYTLDDINNMSDKDIATLIKYIDIEVMDIDIFITECDDIKIIEKVFFQTAEISKKYTQLFDLKWHNKPLSDEYYKDYTDYKFEDIPTETYEIIGFTDKHYTSLEKKTYEIPFPHQKHFLMMGYQNLKPTLLKNKLL